MKKRLIILLCLAVYGSLAYAQADKILGTWLTQDKSAKVEVCLLKGNYYGKVVWLDEPNDPKTGKPWLDNLNPDPKKRALFMLGSTILWGFSYDDGEYVEGKVYDARKGEIYAGKLWLEGDKVLKMRGYIGFLFRTETWVRM